MSSPFSRTQSVINCFMRDYGRQPECLFISRNILEEMKEDALSMMTTVKTTPPIEGEPRYRVLGFPAYEVVERDIIRAA